MPQPSHSRPDITRTAELAVWLEALRLVRLVRGQPLPDTEARAQAERASWAAARNLERAQGRRGETRDHHLRIARQRVMQTAAAYRDHAAASVEVTETAGRIAERLSALARAA